MSQNATTKLFAERLEEQTDFKKDKDYTKSDKKQAEEIDIPYQTFRKYLNDNAECSIDNLKKIAKYYNVSTDYLLGLPREETENTKALNASVYTHLSPKAVLKLAELHGRHIDCIDLLLTNPNFDMLPIALDNYLTAKLTLDKSIKEFANILQKNNIEKEDDIIKQAAKLTYQALTEPNASILKIAECASMLVKLNEKWQFAEYMVQQTMVKILSEFNKEVSKWHE